MDADEFSQIRQQHAQYHQLKVDSERKDLVIADLRTQVAELTKYKEQAYNLRLQLAVTEERARLREAEVLQRSMQQQTHSETDTARRMEEVRNQAERVHQARVAEFQQKIQILEGELASSRRRSTELEKENLQLITRCEALAKEVEDVRRTLLKRESDLSEARRELMTLQGAFAEVSQRAARAEEDADIRTNLAAKLAEVDQLRSERIDLSEKVHELQSRLANAQIELDDTQTRLGTVQASTQLELQETRQRALQQQTQLELDSQRRIEEARRESERARRDVVAEMHSRQVTLESELAAARRKISDIERDNELLSARCETLGKEVDETRALVHRTASKRDQELNDARRDLMALQTTNTELNQRVLNADSDRVSAEASLREAQRRVRMLEEDAELRANFVAAVCRQLYEPASLSDSMLSQSLSSFSPARSLQVSGRTEWAVLQATLSEQTSLAAAERDALRRAKGELQDKLMEAQARLTAAQQELQESWQRSMQQQAQIEVDANRRIEEVRRESESYAEELVSKTHQSQMLLESDLANARRHAAELEHDNQELTSRLRTMISENESAREYASNLFASLQLAVRGVRPLRIRIRELIEQKSILTKRTRRLERAYREMVDLTQALHGEFSQTQRAPSGRKRVTFRVAAIFIIALRRWQRLLGRDAQIGVLTHVSHSSIALATPDAVASSMDVPSFGHPSSAQEEAEAYVQLLQHFDPLWETASDALLTRGLIDSLAQGYRSFKQRQHFLAQQALQQQQFRQLQEGRHTEALQVTELNRLSDSEITPESAIVSVRKGALALSRRVKDLETELESVQRALDQRNDDVSQLKSTLQAASESFAKAQDQAHESGRVQGTVVAELRSHLSSLQTSHDSLAQNYEQAVETNRTQANAITELKSELQKAVDTLAARDKDITALDRRVEEKDGELEDMRSFLKRKTGEIAALEDEKRVLGQRLREVQAYGDTLGSDLQAAQNRIRMLEAELAQRADVTARLEQNVLRFEQQRQHDEETIRQTTSELQRKERELGSCQELIKALTEAHQRATERAAELEGQLTTLHAHIQSLKRELISSAERDEFERRDREEFVRHRQDAHDPSPSGRPGRYGDSTRPILFRRD